jgi:hypothetical protein
MTDDTISTDPKMHAAARKAAAESSAPKPPYDPKAIAREEFERVIDRRYNDKGFDDLWTTITKVHEALGASEDTLGVMTEAEYRQFVASLFHGANAIMLEKTAAALKERSSVLYKAASYSIRDRLEIDEKSQGFPDMLRGLYRTPSKTPTGGRTCPIHPSGCPEDAEAGGAILREIFKSLLGIE